MRNIRVRAERRFRKRQVKNAAVLGEELDPRLAEDRFEIRSRKAEFAGAYDLAMRGRETIKIVGG